MEYIDKRITKLRDYLINVIDTLVKDKKYQINANMLSNDINNYSLDKIPTGSTVEKWIMGIEKHKDVFSFRSRLNHSEEVVNNLENIGFFEDFEYIISSNNKKGILPEIDGIESIECLNCGTLSNTTTNTAEFNIQLEIKYIVNNKKEEQISL